MIRFPRHRWRALLSLWALLLLTPVSAAPRAETETEAAAAAPAAPAAISEQQLREALIDLLRDGAAAPSAAAPPSASGGDYTDAFSRWQSNREQADEPFVTRLRQAWHLLPSSGEQFRAAMARATTPEAGYDGFTVFWTIALAVLLGLAAEYLTTRRLLAKLHQWVGDRERTRWLKVRYIALRTLIQLIGLGALWLASWVCELMNLHGNPYYALLHGHVLLLLLYFRIAAIISRNVFYPAHQPLRMVEVDDRTASALHWWTMGFFFVFFAGSGLLSYLGQADFPGPLVGLWTVPFSAFLNFNIVIALFVFHRAVNRMYLARDEADAALPYEQLLARQGFGNQVFANIWPVLMSAWVITIWLVWLHYQFLGNFPAARTMSVAWYITLAFPILDRLVFALLRNLSYLDVFQCPAGVRRLDLFRVVVQWIFRAVSAIVAGVAMANGMGLEYGQMAADALTYDHLEPLFNGALSLLAVYLLWMLASAYIERNLPEERTALESLEGDGGGAGASREETLLPLLRSTLNVFFVLFLALTALHAAGVAIGPLLAGAGVLGIAIGFGAQKLVQDILSGIFFLIDDAFRRGEYIEIEELRGTVEKISLRSMQLRHHLGAVQTIPYGEIKTVRNLSRDWVTMKLELRLPYETDIEKVRKVIKKTGQKMLDDPELGQNFILPLKSQGVMRVDDSALIVRMKFTAKPGEQWVIRREAYRLVRDALEREGIHFARREVRVLLPESPVVAEQPAAGAATPGAALTAAAGAAAMGAIAAEAAAHAKLDGEGGGADALD